MDEELKKIEPLAEVKLNEFFADEHDGHYCDAAEQFAQLDPTSFNDEDNTIKVRYTNNNKVLRYSWMREEFFYLELSSKVGDVDLTRLNNGASVLNSHSGYTLENVLGAVVPGSATEKEASIKFSSRESIKPIVEDIKAGIIRFVSPGFFIHETKDVTKEGDKYRTLKVTKWEPYEISFVATPADPEAQAFALKQKVEKQKQELAGNQADKTKEQPKMDEETKKTTASAEPAKPAVEDKEAVKAEAKAEEKARTVGIFSIAAQARLGDKFAQEMIASDKSLDEVRTEALNLLAKETEDQEVKGNNFSVGKTAEDKSLEGMTLALEARVGNKPFEKNNEFNNMSLFEMAKFSAKQAGADVSNMGRSQIAEFALHSTSDFPSILANVANKSIRKAYEETPRTFTPFCRKVSLSDFKPVNRVVLSEIPTPTKVTEGGEFNQTTISDGKETYQLATYGEIISITRQTIINDDLSAFNRIPALMGSAAARLEGDLVYGILTGNPNMGDGTALFHANHGNLTDALLLADHATLNYFKHFVKLFRTQKGPKGIANLNLYPDFLIVGPDTEVDAARLLRPIQAVEAGKSNVFAGSSQLIVDSRISDSAFYGAVNPNTIDTIEYGYLEGEEGPQITTKNGFEVDGVQIKMRLDFVAAPIDHRGLAKSTNNDS